MLLALDKRLVLRGELLQAVALLEVAAPNM